MGQRSQIYVSVKTEQNDKPELFAIYFQWNYGSRMVSRVTGLIGWLNMHNDYIGWKKDLIPQVAAVNFDMRDIVQTSDCIKEYQEEDINPFTEQDNNDGKAFISIDETGAIKYCFTDCRITKPMTAKQYMEWGEYGDEMPDSNYSENVDFLDGFSLMNETELINFVDGHYTNYNSEIHNDKPELFGQVCFCW